jgi:hypothetical protein
MRSSRNFNILPRNRWQSRIAAARKRGRRFFRFREIAGVKNGRNR